MNLIELKREIKRLANLPTISKADDERLGQLLVEHDRRRRTEPETVIAGYDEQGWPSVSPTYLRRLTDDEIFTAPVSDQVELGDMACRALDRIEEARGGEIRPGLRDLVRARPDYAERVRATGDPNYARGFAKLLAAGDPGKAMLSMSDGERSAFERVAALDSRAMATGTDSAGGYAVPELLDPSIMLTNAGSVNPFRQVSRIVSGVGNTWRGVSSAGVTASWDGEGVEVSDDSPTLAQPAIEAHKGAAFVPFSIEIEQDWAGMLEQIGRLFADAKDRLEVEAFTNGSGSGQPYGIVTRLDANTAAEVAVTTPGSLVSGDVYEVFSNLPARFRPGASFMGSLDVQNEIRSLGDDKLGNQTVDLRSGYDFTLLGRPFQENSAMPDFPTGSTAAANILIVGDFSNYLIFDRMASARVELVPHLVGANQRPTGQRGAYFYWRTGADVFTASSSGEQGFRLLTNT